MKLIFCFGIILLTITQIISTKFNYNGYKVYSIVPKTPEAVEVINGFRNNIKVDFWSKHRIPNVPIDVMISPDFQEAFEEILMVKDIEYVVLISNVEETIYKNSKQTMSTVLRAGDVSFDKFMRYDEITAYINKLAVTYPNIVSTEVVGQSYEGRNLTLIRISSGGSNKPTIFAEGGIHAREWIAPAFLLYVINQLVENPDNRKLYENVDWLLLPVANPDGYEYTFTDERFWRKTRSKGKLCYGADPNRNFGFHWNESGSDSDECSEIYSGKSAFSENETQAMRTVFNKYEKVIKLYLAVHSYGPLLVYPYSYDFVLPDNADQLEQIAQNFSRTIKSLTGTAYTVGNSADILYTSAGCSDDYSMGAHNVSLAYTIELPGEGFDPPESQIRSLVNETWHGIQVLQKYVEQL